MSSSGVSNFPHASTPAGGFVLQNATPTIFALNTPNDGAQHIVLLSLFVVVTVAEVGGSIVCTDVIRSLGAQFNVDPGGRAIGNFSDNILPFVVDPNTTITVVQGSALTGGAATVFGSMAII